MPPKRDSKVLAAPAAPAAPAPAPAAPPRDGERDPEIGVDGPFINETVLGTRGYDKVSSGKKICKIYVVLHGNGVRAQETEREGEGSDEDPNFFILGEGLDTSVNTIKLFRMVAPGMVFMSHIDINKDLRNKLLKHPLDNWLDHLKNYTTLTPQQMAAASHQEDVDPDDEKWIKSRAIFRQLLQLFNKGDRLTNERLMTDLGKPGGSTGEHLNEFGVWLCEGNGGDWEKIIGATDEILTGGAAGAEVEITLQKLINYIVTQQGNRCTDYEFYIANCSPIPSDKRSDIGRLQSTTVNNGDTTKWIRAGDYSTVTLEGTPRDENINFWLNTLYIHYKRLKLYHQGKESLNSLIKESTPSEQQPKELPQVPPQDTIWGMMDSEERQDHYKLINGLLYMYPYFLSVASRPRMRPEDEGETEEDEGETEEVVLEKKKRIKDMMIFIIKTITTPFNEQIRGGQPHEKGASQVTKYSGTVEDVAGSDGASKVEPGQGYYTLSQGVARKIAAVITASGRSADIDREILPDYKEMLQNVYGMGESEINNKISPNYPFKPTASTTEILPQWKALLPVPGGRGGGNKLRKKKSRKKRRKRRKKTRRKKKKKRKNKTRKKKRRRKKRTKRKK